MTITLLRAPVLPVLPVLPVPPSLPSFPLFPSFPRQSPHRPTDLPSFMPLPERRALLLLLTLAVAGQGVRLLATRPGEPPGQVQLLSTLPDGSPTGQRDSTMH